MSDSVIQEQWLAAQQTVLGSVLIDSRCASEVLARTQASDFTGVYREIFLILRELVQEGSAPDPLAVLNRMESRDGSARKLIAELIDLTPTSANCRMYIDILVEQAKLHQVRQLSQSLLECRSLAEVEETSTRLAELIAVRSQRQVFGMQELLERFYERHTDKHPVRYLTWGMEGLDMRLYAEYGDFIILGGYPSDGKTALALSFAWHQSGSDKVGFFSLETREDKMFDRQVAMVTGIPMGRIKRNLLEDGDWVQMAERSRDICGHTLDIIPAAGMSATEVMHFAKARGYQVIYIDYLQLLRPDNPRLPRYEQVSQTSMTLHTLANQYGISVVGLSQLRRPDRTRGRTAPSMSDLRESGQLEQDADVILLLYRPCPDNPSLPDRDLMIAKNKEGQAQKVVPLTFDGSTQRFSSRKVHKSLGQQVAEAKEQMAYESSQMQLLEDADAELPFP